MSEQSNNDRKNPPPMKNPMPGNKKPGNSGMNWIYLLILLMLGAIMFSNRSTPNTKQVD
jgi:hypothetical protein